MPSGVVRASSEGRQSPSVRSHRPATVVAVTGTNGKTSVAAFVRQIWTRLGHKAASLGTTGVISPKGTRGIAHTTPDPVALHEMLNELADGCVKGQGGLIAGIHLFPLGGITAAATYANAALDDHALRAQG